MRRTESVKCEPSADTANFCHFWTYEAAIDYTIPFSFATELLTLRVTYAVVRGLRIVPVELRDLRHGLYTDDALDREVRLVRKTAREAVRTELLRGLQRVSDQEVCPLVEQVELHREVGQRQNVSRGVSHGRALLT